MALRSARTEYLLELAQGLDKLQTQTAALAEQIDSALQDTPPPPLDTAQQTGSTTGPRDLSADESVARETIRTRVVALRKTMQQTLTALETLLERR